MIRKKTGFWTFIFSLIPGAGEMYLGFFKQGISLMLLFFAAVTISSFNGGTGVFIMLLPVIWFYGFFHVHNLASLPDEEFYALEDSYLWDSAQGSLLNGLPQVLTARKGQRIVGILFVLIGLSSLWNVLRSFLYRYLDEAFYTDYIRPLLDNIPRALIGILIILVGIWLITGKKKELLSGGDDSASKEPAQLETKNE